jgi:hypothetical protein
MATFAVTPNTDLDEPTSIAQQQSESSGLIDPCRGAHWSLAGPAALARSAAMLPRRCPEA